MNEKKKKKNIINIYILINKYCLLLLDEEQHGVSNNKFYLIHMIYLIELNLFYLIEFSNR